MHPIRILALDLDGTLVTENHQISDETRRSLAQLSEQDVELIIATGRRYRTTRYVIDNLGFPVHAVCNGGALIKHRDQSTLQHDCMTGTDFAEMVRLARSNDLALIAQRDSHTLGGADFVMDNGVTWNDPTRLYFEDNRDFAAMANHLAETISDEYLVLGVFGMKASLQTFCRQLNQDFPGRYHTVIVPFNDVDAWYCEITQAHVTKWSGLTFLANILEVAPHSICAVGDEINDLDMIQHAGIGVAMGNANPELKKEADWICGNHDVDGLLMVIDYIKEHNDKRQ